jgi:hypothetical protein
METTNRISYSRVLYDRLFVLKPIKFHVSFEKLSVILYRYKRKFSSSEELCCRHQYRIAAKPIELPTH